MRQEMKQSGVRDEAGSLRVGHTTPPPEMKRGQRRGERGERGREERRKGEEKRGGERKGKGEREGYDVMSVNLSQSNSQLYI